MKQEIEALFFSQATSTHQLLKNAVLGFQDVLLNNHVLVVQQNQSWALQGLQKVVTDADTIVVSYLRRWGPIAYQVQPKSRLFGSEFLHPVFLSRQTR